MYSMMEQIAANSKNMEKKVDEGINPQVIDLINKLFAFFYVICRGFEKQYHDPKRLILEKTQWIKAFQDEGIVNYAQIDSGIRRTRRESPINTPTIGQFIDWCLPKDEDLNIPTLDKAFVEACENSHPSAHKVWSHALVQHAWKLTGSFQLTHYAASKTKPIFQRNYEIAIREWRAGKPIEEINPLMAIADIPEKKRCPDVAKKALSECFKILS